MFTFLISIYFDIDYIALISYHLHSPFLLALFTFFCNIQSSFSIQSFNFLYLPIFHTIFPLPSLSLLFPLLILPHPLPHSPLSSLPRSFLMWLPTYNNRIVIVYLREAEEKKHLYGILNHSYVT